LNFELVGESLVLLLLWFVLPSFVSWDRGLGLWLDGSVVLFLSCRWELVLAPRHS
jgi:hypothetical protein